MKFLWEKSWINLQFKWIIMNYFILFTIISMSVLLLVNVAASIYNHRLSTYMGLACATRGLSSGSAPACRQNKITHIIRKHLKLQLCNEWLLSYTVYRTISSSGSNHMMNKRLSVDSLLLSCCFAQVLCGSCWSCYLRVFEAKLFSTMNVETNK